MMFQNTAKFIFPSYHQNKDKRNTPKKPAEIKTYSKARLAPVTEFLYFNPWAPGNA